MTTEYIGRSVQQLLINGEEGSTSYAKLASFIYGGKLAWGLPSESKALAYTSGSGYDVRIYDITNSQVIVELTGLTNTTPEIVDLGVLANVPDTPAIWEIQVKRPAGPPMSTFVESAVFVF